MEYKNEAEVTTEIDTIFLDIRVFLPKGYFSGIVMQNFFSYHFQMLK